MSIVSRCVNVKRAILLSMLPPKGFELCKTDWVIFHNISKTISSRNFHPVDKTLPFYTYYSRTSFSMLLGVSYHIILRAGYGQITSVLILSLFNSCDHHLLSFVFPFTERLTALCEVSAENELVFLRKWLNCVVGIITVVFLHCILDSYNYYSEYINSWYWCGPIVKIYLRRIISWLSSNFDSST